LTEEEKDHELVRLRQENTRLTEERREADRKWREETTENISTLKRGVTDINKKMDSFIRKELEQDKRLDEHHGSLYGTPAAPTSGVVLRASHLEEKAKHASKLYWLVVSFIVTTVCGAILAAIIYLPKG